MLMPNPTSILTTTSQPGLAVLLVDGSAAIRESLRAMFKEEPTLCIVAEADSRAKALDLFFQHRPDVVLVDVCLPDASGFELVQCLRQADAHCSLVLMGKGPDRFVEKVGHLMGATEVCHKKNDLKSVREALRRLVQLRCPPATSDSPKENVN